MNDAPAPRPSPHLVLGGARSGKSRYAESLVLASPGPRTYIATAQILDDEMRSRVEIHRRRRGSDWRTIECPLLLPGLLLDLEPQGNPVLVDCLTLWMSNILHHPQSSPPEAHIQSLCDALHRITYPLVLVSNEVGSGIVPENALARRFRDLAGLANQRLAEACPRVTLVVAGLPLLLK